MKMSNWFVMSFILALVSCNPSKQAQSERQGALDPKCESKFDQNTCGKSESCEWNGTTCSGSTTYCSGFSSQNNCPVSCQWSVSLLKCQMIVQTTPIDSCPKYSTPETCQADFSCSWNNTSCTKKAIADNSLPIGNTNPNGIPNDPNSQNNQNGQNQQLNNGQCPNMTIFQCIMAQQCTYKVVPFPPHCELKI